MKCVFFLSAMLCGAAAPAQSPANLVKNPGFEDAGAVGLPTHWSSRGFDKTGGQATIDSTIAHSGRRSLRLGTKSNAFVTCSAERVSVKPNTTYYLVYWCKTQGFKRARAYAFLQTNKPSAFFPTSTSMGPGTGRRILPSTRPRSTRRRSPPS